jgi:hypothetical protein
MIAEEPQWYQMLRFWLFLALLTLQSLSTAFIAQGVSS